MTRNEQIVEDLEYLKAAGLPREALQGIHHLGMEGGGFDEQIKYFGTKSESMHKDGTNARYASRVRMMVDLHRRQFEAFAELALKAHPL